MTPLDLLRTHPREVWGPLGVIVAGFLVGLLACEAVAAIFEGISQ